MPPSFISYYSVYNFKSWNNIYLSVLIFSGLVLFLEEDHYVAEDFLYLLEMMQRRTRDLCPHCNILSLGTYLKTFNYYTYNSKVSEN